MSKRVKIIILTVLIILLTILDVYATLTNSSSLIYKVGVLPMFFVVVLYVVVSNKKIIWFLAFQLMCLLGDVLFVYFPDLLMFRTYIYLVAYSLLSYSTFIGIKKRSLKKIGLYIVFTLLLFAVILASVLNVDMGKNFTSIFLYGIVLSILIALALYNYLSKMNEINLLILLGVFFVVISDSIYSTVVFREEEVVVISLVLVTYTIAQYLLCRAFILKDGVLETCEES